MTTIPQCPPAAGKLRQLRPNDQQYTSESATSIHFSAVGEAAAGDTFKQDEAYAHKGQGWEL